MKNILPWIKSHWQIVLFSAFIPLVLVGTFIGASMWNATIKGGQEARANDQLTKLKALKVTYSVPSLSTDGKAVEQSAEPNTVRTEYFAKLKDLTLEQGKKVVERAEAFNRASLKPLVEGVFPEPPPEQVQRKTLELAQRLVGDRGTTRAYQELLDDLRAGQPLATGRVGEVLKSFRDREVEKIAGGANARPLTPEETEALNKRVVEQRLAAYQGRANELSVYADLSIFPGGESLARATPGDGGGGEPYGGSTDGPNRILTVKPPTPPTLKQAFEWQYDYWMFQEVLRVVRSANADGRGGLKPLPQATVKRIVSVRTYSPAAFGARPEVDPNSTEATAAAGPATLTTVLPRDLSVSITGRKDGPANPLYDLRRATLELIVASERVPQLLDAASSTNFMSVLGLRIDAVDTWSELQQGYYYGEESVVRVTIDLETIWLRSWLEPLMPRAVRAMYGLATPEPAAGEGTGDPTAAPAGDAVAPADGAPADAATPDAAAPEEPGGRGGGRRGRGG